MIVYNSMYLTCCMLHWAGARFPRLRVPSRVSLALAAALSSKERLEIGIIPSKDPPSATSYVKNQVLLTHMQVILAKEAIPGSQKILQFIYYPTSRLTAKSDMSHSTPPCTYGEVSASEMSKPHPVRSIALRVVGLRAVRAPRLKK